MKNFVLFLFLCFCVEVYGQDHGTHHAKHGFLIYGKETLFASHIVYKVPHNYQVILQLQSIKELDGLPEVIKSQFPNNKLVLVFDEMDLTQIVHQPIITGMLYREDEEGVRHPLKTMSIDSSDYEVIFFNELPAF